MKNIKGITKWLLGAAMAGAFILAVPHQAKAQEYGYRKNMLPAYHFYAPVRHDEWRRREYFEHQRWEREHWRRERWERYHDRRW